MCKAAKDNRLSHHVARGRQEYACGVRDSPGSKRTGDGAPNPRAADSHERGPRRFASDRDVGSGGSEVSDLGLAVSLRRPVPPNRAGRVP